MIYFIVTTSLFDNCDIRKQQYVNGITKLKKVIQDKNIQNCQVIIVENNGVRDTYLDTLGCQVHYTETNFLNAEKGLKEMLDVWNCIEKFHIQEDDFIVKMTGRYCLEDDSEFMNEIGKLDLHDYDCIIKYGCYSDPKNYKMKDCITGLIGMRCRFVKQIEKPNNDECVEWKWASATYLMEDSKICIVDKLGIHICPGSHTFFLV